MHDPMQRRNPPKHRHDGTSPLPLGMDWSPPPRKWNGRDTVWPHDAHTGWSYCVTIPSWTVLPKTRDSEPVVFFRVQVAIQSPEGITTTHCVSRRFNDFLKLLNDLKKSFPTKSFAPAPPKGLLRMKRRVLLEERRRSLEEWMTKVLSDIDLSRSVAVASCLELDTAARSSFQDVNQQDFGTNVDGYRSKSLPVMPTNPSISIVAGSSSVTSDYSSDTPYETCEHGTPLDSSEAGPKDLTLGGDLMTPIQKLVKYGVYNIDEGLLMGQTILDQLEGLDKHKSHHRQVNSILVKETCNGNLFNDSFLLRNGFELLSENDPAKLDRHAHKHSTETVGGEESSIRGSQMPNSGISNSTVDDFPDISGAAEALSNGSPMRNTVLQFSGDAQVVLPMDQRQKMNKVLLAMQQRIFTSKTDMEDLIARLDQEMAVKDYLTTKVKDLEVELASTKQKNKEHLQEAILIENERFTQMKWDMEELKRKALEMEFKLQSKQDDIPHGEQSSIQHRDTVLLDLGATKQKLEKTLRRNKDLEAKSKADIKVLVKEVKSLRSSQVKLKEELRQSLIDNSQAEEFLQQERKMTENAKVAKEKLIHECMTIYKQLMECNTNFLSIDDEGKFTENPSSLSGALNLLTTSDDRITLLFNEWSRYPFRPLHIDDNLNLKDCVSNDLQVQVFAGGDDIDHNIDDDVTRSNVELRKILANIFTESAKLRKEVNFFLRRALKMNSNPLILMMN